MCRCDGPERLAYGLSPAEMPLSEARAYFPRTPPCSASTNGTNPAPVVSAKTSRSAAICTGYANSAVGRHVREPMAIQNETHEQSNDCINKPPRRA
jgi:hypothetical protein